MKSGYTLGNNISKLQEISVETDYPQLQLNQKQAIEKCKGDCGKEYLDLQRLPDEMLKAIHEHGLYDKYVTMQKMMIGLPKCNQIEHLLNYIKRSGMLPGVEPKMKSMHV